MVTITDGKESKVILVDLSKNNTNALPEGVEADSIYDSVDADLIYTAANSMKLCYYTGADIKVGDVYTVNGNEVTAQGMVNEDGSVTAYLCWTADTATTTFTLDGVEISGVKSVDYDYTVNIDKLGLNGQKYTYTIEAYDFYGNKTTSKVYDLIADSNAAPYFDATDVSTNEFGYKPSQDVEIGEYGQGFIRENDRKGFEHTTYLTGNISCCRVYRPHRCRRCSRCGSTY